MSNLHRQYKYKTNKRQIMRCSMLFLYRRTLLMNHAMNFRKNVIVRRNKMEDEHFLETRLILCPKDQL